MKNVQHFIILYFYARMFAEGDNMFRIGQSIDIHQLVEGRKLILGGVEIPYEKGLKGHNHYEQSDLVALK